MLLEIINQNVAHQEFNICTDRWQQYVHQQMGTRYTYQLDSYNFSGNKNCKIWINLVVALKLGKLKLFQMLELVVAFSRVEQDGKNMEA